MSAYKTVLTKIYQPDSQPVTSAPAQGEWINPDPQQVAEVRGLFRPLPAILAESVIGQGSEQVHRWRGPLPNGTAPAPGWEIEIESERYRVVAALRSMGRTWKLDCVAAA